MRGSLLDGKGCKIFPPCLFPIPIIVAIINIFLNKIGAKNAAGLS